MKCPVIILAGMTLLVFGPARATCQWLEPPGFQTFTPAARVVEVPVLSAFAVADSSESSTGLMIAGGIVGGAAGAIVGGSVGWVAGSAANCYDFDCVAFLIVGMALGESAGVPLGVHLANGRQGNLGGGMALSYALGSLGTLAMLYTWEDRVFSATAVTIPIVQIGLALAVERRTGLAQENERN